MRAATFLANTAQSPDSLTTTGDVDDFVERFGYTGRHEGTARELRQLRDLRVELHDLLLADRDSAVETVNAWLSAAGAVPQLVRHNGFDWHVHAVSPRTPLATRVRVETAMAMVDLIRTDETSRLSVCADESCEGVVLDLSRNRSRIYCSVACTNRTAAASYRARRR